MRILIIILMLAIPVLSQAGQVYKWRDKNGNVHYSDVEPANQKAQNKTPKKPAGPKPMTEKEAECARLQGYVKVLTDSEVVKMDLNNDGVVEELNSAQRAEQTKLMQERAAASCKE
ncbi:MAG: DUF4124 domain-containing protein [Arenimonas sp.]